MPKEDMLKELRIGLKAKSEQIVTEDMLASKVGSGLVDVFSTPKLVALIEQAASEAVKDYLPDGDVSVGININIDHLAATPLGMKVRAEAELVAIDKKRLTFKVKAYDQVDLIAQGDHQRYVVNRQKFMSNVENKS